MPAEKPPADSGGRKTPSESLDDWLGQRVDDLSQLYNDVADGKEPITYVTTGLKRLDDAGLWELGVLHGIIGHEGDGKTTLIVQAAESAARVGHIVHLYIPEDPREMIADRVLAPILDVSAFDIRRLKIQNPRGVPERLRAARKAASRWATNIKVHDNKLTSKEFIESLYDLYNDEEFDLVAFDYIQLFSSEQDEKSVERVIAGMTKEYNIFCKNPTRAKRPPADFKVAGVAMSQVGGHVKRRGVDWFQDSKRAARFDKEGNFKPSVEWIEGFRPLPGDAQWAPTAFQQQCRAVISILRPNDILTMMGVAGLEDNVMEIMPIKNNYSRKPKMIRLKFDGARARLSEFKKAE